MIFPPIMTQTITTYRKGTPTFVSITANELNLAFTSSLDLLMDCANLNWCAVLNHVDWSGFALRWGGHVDGGDGALSMLIWWLLTCESLLMSIRRIVAKHVFFYSNTSWAPRFHPHFPGLKVGYMLIQRMNYHHTKCLANLFSRLSKHINFTVYKISRTGLVVWYVLGKVTKLIFSAQLLVNFTDNSAFITFLPLCG